MKNPPQQRSAPWHGRLASWRLAFWLLVGLMGLCTWYETRRLFFVEERLGGLERGTIDEETLRAALQAELSSVRGDLVDLRGDLKLAAEEAERARILAERVNLTERWLGDVGQAVEAQAMSLSELEQAQASFGPEIERELEERDRRLLHRWETLSELASSAKRHADENRRKLELWETASSRDLIQMWRELVGPVVQLAGESSVGSGVLLRSRETEDGRWSTYAITAWHVVRDIQGDLSRTEVPVPVRIYAEDGSIREEEATLLTFNADLDAAVLTIVSDEPIQNGASLAGREHLASVRIFDEVYAVGCPLGNDPIPTRGEIATARHAIEGENYWMINAPTYIGNSGGGIFDLETHELIGIFSKIYTHGSLRPTIVPHMGLVTPLDAIYGWLEEEGYGDVEEWGTQGADAVGEVEPEVASAGG